MKNWIIGRAGAAILAVFVSGGAAHAATDTVGSDANIVGPITITAGDTLNFGRFAPDNPAGNTLLDMLPDGSVVCANASLCNAGSPKAASFSVSATPNQLLHISMPGNFFLTNGPDSVEIGNGVFFGPNVTQVSYFNSTGITDASGNLDFKFRGALWMTAGTPVGAFSGTYTVTVNYQ